MRGGSRGPSQSTQIDRTTLKLPSIYPPQFELHQTGIVSLEGAHARREVSLVVGENTIAPAFADDRLAKAEAAQPLGRRLRVVLAASVHAHHFPVRPDG